MTLHIQPIADYTNVEYCKGVATNFVHPHTGYIYSVSIEKKDSAHQDAVVRRMPPNLPARWEEVIRYRGGIDAVGPFDMGGAVINRHGVLLTTFTCQPKDHPLYKPDGFPKFQSCWDWEAGVDEPWLTDPATDELKAQVAQLQAENAALTQRIAALEAQAGGSLSPEDRASLDWTAAVRAIE